MTWKEARAEADDFTTCNRARRTKHRDLQIIIHPLSNMSIAPRVRWDENPFKLAWANIISWNTSIFYTDEKLDISLLINKNNFMLNLSNRILRYRHHLRERESSIAA